MTAAYPKIIKNKKNSYSVEEFVFVFLDGAC